MDGEYRYCGLKLENLNNDMITHISLIMGSRVSTSNRKLLFYEPGMVYRVL